MHENNYCVVHRAFDKLVNKWSNSSKTNKPTLIAKLNINNIVMQYRL